MYGSGEDMMEWNNTGVNQDFACAKGIVHIPEGKKAVHTSVNWQIFNISESIFLATYSEKELGLMVILRTESAKKALDSILQNNPDKKLYYKQFKHPNGNLIEYDLDAPRDIWVIHKINGKGVDRKFDQWPFFEGNI